MQIERDISKFLMAALVAMVIADVLTHGDVAVKLGQLGSTLLGNIFRLAAGQKAA